MSGPKYQFFDAEMAWPEEGEGDQMPNQSTHDGVRRTLMDKNVNPGFTPADLADAADAFKLFLQHLGVETNTPDREDTPMRFTKAMLYHLYLEEPWELTTFPVEEWSGEPGAAGDLGIVIQRDIPLYSLCAHHLQAFEGTCHVAYIPNQRMAGLSKLARTVTMFCKGLNSQEIIGQRVADFLMEQLEPMGVAVVINASHSCMTSRGVRAHSAITTTSTLRGKFFTDQRTRDELMSLLQLSSNGR